MSNDALRTALAQALDRLPCIVYKGEPHKLRVMLVMEIIWPLIAQHLATQAAELARWKLEAETYGAATVRQRARAEAAEASLATVKRGTLLLEGRVDEILKRFKESEAAGYRSKERQYVITMLDALREAAPAPHRVQPVSEWTPERFEQHRKLVSPLLDDTEIARGAVVAPSSYQTAGTSSDPNAVGEGAPAPAPATETGKP